MGHGEAQGEGAGAGEGLAGVKGSIEVEGELCPGLCYSFLWFLAFYFVVWPVAFFLAGIYVFLLPFSVCIAPLRDVCDILLKLLRMPYEMVENMIQMKPCDQS